MKITNISLAVILCLVTTFNATSQARYNFGERHTQSDLPRSRAPYGVAVAQPKPPDPLRIELREGIEYTLRGGWELAQDSVVIAARRSIFDPAFDTSKGWYNATVPGTVLTTLVDCGVYPNPYWGLNNLTIPESLCRTAWWYRLRFDMPEQERGKRVFIRFEGVNYKAQVWINYHLAGEITGAFRRGEFDISSYLNDENNVLAVKIFPPNNPGIPQEQNGTGHGDNGGALCLDGATFISSEGWDWMPAIRDRNIGIWQDVVLAFRRSVSIVDPQIITDLPLPATNYADLKVKVGLHNHSNHDEQTMLRFKVEDVMCEIPVVLKAGEVREVTLTSAEFPQLRLQNPRLWYPNGYGKPELYTSQLTVEDRAGISDQQSVRFGVREFEYELSVSDRGVVRRINFNPTTAYADARPVIDNLTKVEVQPSIWAPSLIEGVTAGVETCNEMNCAPYIRFKVNGLPIFCKGGNWGMDDAMKRVSRERLEPYVCLHKEQGFTMIRNWTAESTEKVFYDLCDEYGILVFNDFGLSTENFNLLPLDYDLFLANVRDIVTRYRNHPSIAVWCPQNEGFPPAYLEHGFSKIIASVDGTRHYIGNSRTLNTIKSGPWQYTQPQSYFNMAVGFASEVGTPSVPAAESVRRMMASEDTWPIGDVWYYHDYLMGKWGATPLIHSYDVAINNQFGASDDLDTFCSKAQLINYESHRAIFEGWNSKLFASATGVLLWMSHPAWPSMVWQTYSWDYETPGAYFGAKKGCEPLHVQWSPTNGVVQVINTSATDYTKLTVESAIYDLDGRKCWSERRNIASQSNTAVEAGTIKCDATLPNVYFIRLILRDAKGHTLSRNDYWHTDSAERNFIALNSLPEVRLRGGVKATRRGDGVAGVVTITNPSRGVALAVKLNLRNETTGEAILPTYFDDGYFLLLPGEDRTIGFSAPAGVVSKRLSITAEAHNAERIQIATIN